MMKINNNGLSTLFNETILSHAWLQLLLIASIASSGGGETDGKPTLKCFSDKFEICN